jgi:hypothetical protein
MPLRRWHEVGHTIEKLEGLEFDDAVLPRGGGLALPAGADPLPALVAGQRGADAFGTAVAARLKGESLEREGRAGAGSQEVLKAPRVARHVAVEKADADARVDRKAAVLPGEHVGGGLGVEESVAEEPAHESRADAPGERHESGGRDGPGRQKRDAFLSRHEDAVGDAGVQVNVAVQGGAEAVEEKDGAEPGAALAKPQQRMPQRRYSRNSASTCVGRGARRGCGRRASSPGAG